MPKFTVTIQDENGKQIYSTEVNTDNTIGGFVRLIDATLDECASDDEDED